VVAGASAGGVEALVALVRSLPPDFPHPVLVVLHVSPAGTSVLPAILRRACALPVAAPRDGDPLQPGHVYVAPPDCHLLVEESRLRLSHAPRENGHRPAIDPTMRTAAGAFDGRTIGIVLSGSRDDGTAGLMEIKEHGGLAIAQDPDEALYDAMPRSAIDHVELDAVLPIAAMADWILGHAGDPSARESDDAMPSEHISNANPNPDLEPGSGPPPDRPRTAPGAGTRFTCPDCGGVLFERTQGSLARFECSVGHVFSIESLSLSQAQALEAALWAAVRSLEDRAAMLERLGARAHHNGQPRSAGAFEREAREAVERAGTIRDTLLDVQDPSLRAVAS
jgi:two-component system chemotaxis response regulator CheB